MPSACIFRFFWLTLCPIMRKVKLFLTDVDGCLTDGGMYYGADGEEMKRFCVYDGMGIVRLQYLRMGVGSQVQQGATTKLEAAEEICRELGITLEDVCFVGDDINDLDLLRAVGLPACPPNARPEVLALPRILRLQTPGGQGAIRELADKILDLTI